MRYGSFCSGIEAPSVAWAPLGWEAAWFSEIDTFASAVLKHHYPAVPNPGDITDPPILKEISKYEPVDLVIAGTPCQSFSIAGQRKGMDDDRGDLTLTFLRLLGRIRPRWFIWENVPGVLSIEGGRTFGAILRKMAECGYGLAYRILDARYFGVPQRRRRVFVVGYLGDWRPATAVLLDSESLQGNTSTRRKAGEEIATTLGNGAGWWRKGMRT